VKSLWTPTELAAEVGVSRAAVYAWLRGTFPRPVDGRWLLDEDMAARARAVHRDGADPGAPTGTVLGRRVRPTREGTRVL